jgi:hypothetical protein
MLYGSWIGTLLFVSLCIFKPVLPIRICFSADPDPAFKASSDPDPVQDPGFGKSLLLECFLIKKLQFSCP